MKYKFELIPSDKEGLFRIKALRNFSDVKKGDIGGYVEKEYNLSHYGDCWIYGDAIVANYARVYDNAWVLGNAKVYNNATIAGSALVFGDARVYGNAKVRGNAQVYGNAKVYGDALVNGYASIYGDAVIKKTNDYLVLQNTQSNGQYFTWTRSNNMWKVGGFHVTGEELIKMAYADSELKGKVYEMTINYVNELLKAEK
jgi:NDP-sugar pyrophosphorylase family protein